MKLAFPAALLAVAVTTGCAHRPPPAVDPYGSAYPAPVYSPGRRGDLPGSSAAVDYGVVQRIDVTEARGQPSGAGALIGGVVGAVVGRQFGGGGGGRAAGTVVGAMGGAVVGNEIERQQSGARSGVVRVQVALERGGVRSLEVRDVGDLRVGDRVRIEGDRLMRL